MPVVSDHTALLSGSTIYGEAGRPAFLTFSFFEQAPSAEFLAGHPQWRSLSEFERVQARAAFDAWAAASGIVFLEVRDAEGAIRVSAYDLLSQNLGGEAWLPDDNGSEGNSSDVFVDGWGMQNWGDFIPSLLLHEIGHALGLKHPFAGEVTLDPSLDRKENTVMSYTQAGPEPIRGLGYLDRDAIQALYGAAGTGGTQVESWSWDAAARILTQRGFPTADLLLGVTVTDVILGGDGADRIRGYGGADTLDGGDGDDEIDGGNGDDIITGASGNDVLQGAEGDDDLDGGGGNDRLWGGFGRDRIAGGAGDDSLAAFGADDRLAGDDGDDVLTIEYYQGKPAFAVDGGAGFDRLVVQLAAGSSFLDLAAFLAAGEVVAIEHVSAVGDVLNPTALRLVGTDGDDTLSAGAEAAIAPAWLSGREGDDAISGGKMDDALEGEDGADVIRGFEGEDQLFGGRGADRLFGGSGADRFMFRSFADSPSFADGDIIEDFESFQDKIDLTALGAVTIEIASDDQGFQRVTATGSGGVLQFRIRSGTGVGVAATPDYFAVSAVPLGATAGADRISGSEKSELAQGLAGNDLFFMQQGGFDKVDAGAGNDGIYFGSAFQNDMVDGGDGIDTLALQGQYLDDGNVITIGEASRSADLSIVTNVEVIYLLSGSDTRFGDLAGNSYDYLLRASDINIGASGLLTVIASDLRPGEDLSFQGSAEAGGSFRIFAGRGVDFLVGGAGNDGFFFGADGNLTAADRVVGWTGTDSVALRGNYAGAGAITFASDTIKGIEVLALLSGHSSEHGGFLHPEGFDYDLALADGNVAPGDRLDVIATGLCADESARFDARAETDGAVRILAGAGEDILYGGFGADTLYGGLGGDTLDGGAGADLYQYRNPAESMADAADRIAFAAGDRIDLAAIDAVVGSGANEAFAFIGAAAFSNVAGQLRIAQVGAGAWQVEGDVDGDGLADLVIAVASAAPLAAADFVL